MITIKKRPKVNIGHNENGLGRGHNKWKKHIKEQKGKPVFITCNNNSEFHSVYRPASYEGKGIAISWKR